MVKQCASSVPKLIFMRDAFIIGRTNYARRLPLVRMESSCR